jgi:uncharacterized membrane protein YkvA (DUF1232 family)
MKPGRLLRSISAANLAVYLIALWKLFRHPETPRAAKWVAIATLAYAVSPIDLIPDFIPVLGQLDDLLLIPLGVALVVQLTPRPLWDSLLAQARLSREQLPRLWWGAAAVLLVWALMLGLVVWFLMAVLSGG